MNNYKQTDYNDTINNLPNLLLQMYLQKQNANNSK